jgi:hypothetical protein
MPSLLRALAAAAFMLFATGVMADDWVASRLRGPVLQLQSGTWQPLNRGDIVPDSRSIRTLATGHVTLVRGTETIDLGPNTQIKIHDRGGAKPFTTVTQAVGQVTIEAEVQNVQHFAVNTPFLAAVVKGTRFVVTSGKSSATVTVRRGHVAVEDTANRQHVTIGVGQTATADNDKTTSLAVSGTGTLPAVVTASGTPVTTTDAATTKASTDKAAKKSDKPAGPEKSGKVEKPEKSAKPDKPDKPEKPVKPEKPSGESGGKGADKGGPGPGKTHDDSGHHGGGGNSGNGGGNSSNSQPGHEGGPGSLAPKTGGGPGDHGDGGGGHPGGGGEPGPGHGDNHGKPWHGHD